MPDRPLRVAVISTGGIGSLAIPAIARRDDLELVGVWVHSPEKTGKDVGDVLDIGPLGVTTTNSFDDIIALKPDCAVYAASAPEMDAAAVVDYEKLLTGGVNIVTTTTPGMIFPGGWFPEFATRVQNAAVAGGVSAYTSGIEPGFAADHLPVLLSTLCTTIKSIRTQEIFDYSEYPVTYWMFDAMGFGMPMNYTPLLALPGSQQYAGQPVVSLVAKALGIEFDEVTESYERAPAPRDIQVASGLIKAGTCGAVRFQVSGVINGEPVVTVEHVNRMAQDLAPEWAQAENGTYRIIIEGEPKMRCELKLGEDDLPKTANDAGMLATCMRAVNAIPYVVDAQPGIVTSLDLPITAPRHAIAPSVPTS
jgi:hypothetical protein